MAKKYKYVNLNTFPIFLPDSRGGQVMFRTGEGSTKQWFARLVGKRQLTQVPLTAKEGKAAKGIMNIKNAQMDISVPPPASKKDVPVPQDTKEYSFSNGIYTCKLCKGQFRTGSIQSIKEHIMDYHGMRDMNTPAVSSRQSGTEAALISEPAEETTKVTTTAPTPPATPPAPASSDEEVEFACDFPGCGKAFETAKGLNMHKMRMHR